MIIKYDEEIHGNFFIVPTEEKHKLKYINSHLMIYPSRNVSFNIINKLSNNKLYYVTEHSEIFDFVITKMKKSGAVDYENYLREIGKDKLWLTDTETFRGYIYSNEFLMFFKHFINSINRQIDINKRASFVCKREIISQYDRFADLNYSDYQNEDELVKAYDDIINLLLTKSHNSSPGYITPYTDMYNKIIKLGNQRKDLEKRELDKVYNKLGIPSNLKIQFYQKAGKTKC